MNRNHQCHKKGCTCYLNGGQKMGQASLQSWNFVNKKNLNDTMSY